MHKKALEEQTIVITGASSGIGHATARLAVERGARVAICARSAGPLEELAQELGGKGAQVLAVEADVRNQQDMQTLARAAIERFGGFDTWVNNAGVSIYGRNAEVPIEEQRLLFETNYWGVVHGSLAALPQLKERRGTLINIGSTLSDRAVPLQGAYSASKHAVRGFTDSLRMELEAEHANVAVCLVKPSAINTPYTEHAQNYLPKEPSIPPPVYAPEVVAEAILHCAVHPRRDTFVGAGGKLISLMETFAPRLTDYMMERSMFTLQQQDRPSHNGHTHQGLRRASGEGKETGNVPWHAQRSSLYTKAAMHPFAAALAAAAAGVLVSRLARGRH